MSIIVLFSIASTKYTNTKLYSRSTPPVVDWLAIILYITIEIPITLLLGTYYRSPDYHTF